MSKQVITAREIAEELEVSESKAYDIIRKLNRELKEQGYLTLSGKVSRAYFNDKFYGGVSGGR